VLDSIEAGPQLLRHWIDQAVARDPDKPYICSVDDGRAISYGELQRLTRQIAGYLHQQGIGPADRVALLANNSIEHLVWYLGVMAYGATICTIHVEMNRLHLEHILPALDPRLIVYEEGLQLENLLTEVDCPRVSIGAAGAHGASAFYSTVCAGEPSERTVPARATGDGCIVFTSGTSASPKGVILSFRELLANVEPIADAYDIRTEDRLYDFRSFNWVSAQLLGVLTPLCRGATLLMRRKFSRSQFFAQIREWGATVAAGNPTTINMLLNGDEAVTAADLPTLRFMTSSSAPLLVEEWRRFEDRFGIPVAQGYGCSEAGWIAACPGDRRRRGTVGRPLPYHDVAIVDADGQRLPEGQVGYVELGGFPDNAYRYLNADGKTVVTSRGRMRTGDLGFFDADRYLHLTGREKDLIIRGGVNISLLEIDNILMRRPEVVEAATIGVPHRTYGEEVVSYVVLQARAGVNAEDILRYCNEVLPAFKAPKQIVVSDMLPKTERGKLDRKALVEAWTRSGATLADTLGA
jgi:acyl-coenzyme A synthetase/AMP-(fatty) acid ligase